FRLDGRWTQLTADASLLGDHNRFRLDEGKLAFVASPSALGAFRLTTTGSIERFAENPFRQTSLRMIESALSVQAGHSGAWLGAGSEGTDALTGPLLRAGLWQQVRDMTLSLTADQHRANQPYYLTDTSTAAFTRLVRWSNVQGRVGLAVARVY